MKSVAMTPSTRRSTSAPLREAALALQAAESGMGDGDEAATHKALLDLARTSYESLTAFEHGVPSEQASATKLRDRLIYWRQQLDEARVQLALAELDTRAVREEVAELVERRLEPVADLVSTAVAEIAAVLSVVRKELQEHRPGHEE